MPAGSDAFAGVQQSVAAVIKEVVAVVIVKMMLMMLKMMKMMTMMMFSPPMALWQQRRASTKVL